MSGTTIIICSANRPEILADTIESLSNQSVPVHEILVSVFDPSHVAERTPRAPGVRVIFSPRQGTSVQRNVAIRQVRTPYTLFLDDDIELAPNFIESMERLLGKTESIIAANGFMLIDGGPGDAGLERCDARSCIKTYVGSTEIHDHQDGQNLFVRTAVFQNVLFDENLPLYGWLEDFDFVTNCSRYGRIISNPETCMAHLRTPSGRTSGLRFGYSQIANPIYLWRKNGKPDLGNVVFRHWVRYCASNLRRAVLKKSSDRADGTGRLRGNMLALRHVLGGRVDPTHILRL